MQGLFTQLEYDNDNVSAFVSAAVSNTSYKRIDYFQYTPEDPIQSTDKYNFSGYSIKGGINYNLNDYHNIFASIGYFEKPADFDGVFLNFDNEHINANAENQKIFSAEFGYGLRSEKLAANINVYRTEWKDRTLNRFFQNPDGTNSTANILGVNAIHQGIEVDLEYRASDKIRFTGMLSLGDWEWDSDVTDVEIFDEEQNLIQTIDLYIAGLKVAGAAQTTAALGMDWQIMDKTNFTLDYNYFDNLYAAYDPNDRSTAGAPQAWEAPSYGTFDAGLRYGFKILDLDATLTGRMHNVFDTQYIQSALDGSGSTFDNALVWYGFGRTFNISAKIKF